MYACWESAVEKQASNGDIQELQYVKKNFF